MRATVAGRSSTEPARLGPVAAFTKLSGNERLTALGALVCAGSLVLPWYSVTVDTSLVQTGIGTFGFAQAALLLTVASTLFLLWQVARGRRPALPLKIG